MARRDIRPYDEDEGYGMPMPPPWYFDPRYRPPPVVRPYYQPPQPMYDCPPPRRSAKTRRRLRRKLDLGWKVMLYVVLSFIPAGFDMPGVTLLLWAVGPVILVRACVRD